VAQQRSEIFKLSEEYLNHYLEYDVISATYLNVHKYNDIWNDMSFAEVDPFLKIAKKYRKSIAGAEALDTYDEIAQKVILKELDDYIRDAGDYFYYGYWGSLFSDPEIIYETFKEMPKATPKDIRNAVKRMEAIPELITEWISALKDVAEKDIVNAKLRVGFTIDVINNCSKGKFVKQAMIIAPGHAKLLKAAREAELAYEQLAAWLEVKYMPIAKDNWRVGEERYVKMAEMYSSVKVNPRELYEWGLKDLDAINKEMWKVAKKIKPDATELIEIRDALNANPAYTIHGVDNFKKYLEGVIQFSIKELHPVVFDIPAKARKCIVIMDDDTLDESPYYMSGSDDLEIPGRTYYPTVGRDEFSTWENYSTWFHESVPGHHLQFVTAALNKKTLSKWQRTLGWNSGYSEGWALYSEKLMDELGYFKDSGYKMGYLMCQAMRAARLVVDTGLHLGYEDPNGEVWTFDSAVRFMEERALLQHRYAVNEIKRYISMAGQAVSYKIGEKVWLDARADAEKRLGDKFDLKKFHMHALKLGPMHLDLFKEEMAKWNGR
jgi:uncharacterized protein (DUF885 family)